MKDRKDRTTIDMFVEEDIEELKARQFFYRTKWFACDLTDNGIKEWNKVEAELRRLQHGC